MLLVTLPYMVHLEPAYIISVHAGTRMQATVNPMFRCFTSTSTLSATREVWKAGEGYNRLAAHLSGFKGLRSIGCADNDKQILIVWRESGSVIHLKGLKYCWIYLLLSATEKYTVVPLEYASIGTCASARMINILYWRFHVYIHIGIIFIHYSWWWIVISQVQYTVFDECTSIVNHVFMQ